MPAPSANLAANANAWLSQAMREIALGAYANAIGHLVAVVRRLADLAGLPPADVARVEVALAAIESAFDQEVA